VGLADLKNDSSAFPKGSGAKGLYSNITEKLLQAIQELYYKLFTQVNCTL